MSYHNHKLYKAYIDRYPLSTITKARELDEAETDRVIDEYCRLWDNGQSFSATGFESWSVTNSPRRGGDSEEEIAAATAEIESVLGGVIVRGWIAGLTGAEAAALCNATDYADIAVNGSKLTKSDIVMMYSETHYNAIVTDDTGKAIIAGENPKGDAIREARKAAGLTQVQLAERLACTQNEVSRWESGARVPGADSLKRIAQALECRVEALT